MINCHLLKRCPIRHKILCFGTIFCQCQRWIWSLSFSNLLNVIIVLVTNFLLFIVFVRKHKRSSRTWIENTPNYNKNTTPPRHATRCWPVNWRGWRLKYRRYWKKALMTMSSLLHSWWGYHKLLLLISPHTYIPPSPPPPPPPPHTLALHDSSSCTCKQNRTKYIRLNPFPEK